MDDETSEYYKYFAKTPVSKKYLLLAVKHLNGEGFVITGFFVKRIRKQEKETIYEKEDFHKL